MTADSDFDLLTRWREGDRRAGNELVKRYFDDIRKYFLNSVGDDERDDLVQETFRKLSSSRDKFEGRSSFRSYLFGIAHNTKSDHFRQLYRAKARGQFDPLTHSVEDIDGIRPSHVVTAIERHHRLLGCIRRLPLETKELLELYYWHDFTAGELAEILNIRERALRSRLVAARKRLRECVQGCGESSPDDDASLESQLRELGQFFESGRIGSRNG